MFYFDYVIKKLACTIFNINLLYINTTMSIFLFLVSFIIVVAANRNDS